MAYHRCIEVILHDHVTYIRATTIQQYLPDLWRRYARHFHPNKSLCPLNYLYQPHQDERTRNLLYYLFGYLERVDTTRRKSTILQDFLNHVWIIDGPRDGREAFLGLGYIFLPENFGCNKEIWLTMKNFVMDHRMEIFGSDWVEYIKVLDKIDARQRFSLLEVIWCFASFTHLQLRQLHSHHMIKTLGPRPLKLLDGLIKRRDGNIEGFGIGVGCITCYNLARCKKACDLDARGGEPDLWWTECFEGDFGPADQCELCFRVLGPLRARYRWPLPRAREAGLLHHAAPHGNYETERPRRVFNDIRLDVPRFMQPFFDDVRYGPRFPRRGRPVEVVS